MRTWWTVLALAACGQDKGDGPDGGDADADADTDADADADADSDSDADVTGDTSAPAPSAGWAVFSHLDPNDAAFSAFFGETALFRDRLASLDTCASIEFPAPPTSGEVLDAGAVTVTFGGASEPAEPAIPGHWSLELGPYPAGTAAGVSITGSSELGAFDASAALTLPPTVDVAVPDPIPAAGWDMTWTAGGGDALVLSIVSTDYYAPFLHCVVADDGAYTVEGTLLAAMGTYPVSVFATRYVLADVVVSTGQTFTLAASTTQQTVSRIQ
jgi:hypothetical protein